MQGRPILTSSTDPTLSARGSVMRLGTKNNGKNFASSAAPGLKISYSRGPPGVSKNVAKRAPHPANADGNPMAKVCSSLRKKISSPISKDAAKKVFFKVTGFAALASSPAALVESNVMDLKGLIGFGRCATTGRFNSGDFSRVEARRKETVFCWNATAAPAKTTTSIATFKALLVDHMSTSK